MIREIWKIWTKASGIRRIRLMKYEAKTRVDSFMPVSRSKQIDQEIHEMSMNALPMFRLWQMQLESLNSCTTGFFWRASTKSMWKRTSHLSVASLLRMLGGLPWHPGTGTLTMVLYTLHTCWCCLIGRICISGKYMYSQIIKLHNTTHKSHLP